MQISNTTPKKYKQHNCSTYVISTSTWILCFPQERREIKFSNHEKDNRFYAFICAVEIFYWELLTANEYPTTKVNMKGK